MLLISPASFQVASVSASSVSFCFQLVTYTGIQAQLNGSRAHYTWIIYESRLELFTRWRHSLLAHVFKRVAENRRPKWGVCEYDSIETTRVGN